MGFHFRTSTPEELPRLMEFLRSTHGVDDNHVGFRADHLMWKYFEPREDWEGSRSYILEDKDRIVAHLAILPAKMQLGSRMATCMHFIDWVAAPGQFVPGSILLRKTAQLFDVTFCIGGSADNRRLLPKFGFQPLMPAAVYARPIRPFRQMLSHPRKDWRLPLRLGRNLAYSQIPLNSPGSWKAVPASPRDVPGEVWTPPAEDCPVHVRAPAMYEYFLRSKEPPFGFYLLEDAGRPAGGLCIAFPPGQARIADIWLLHPSPDALAQALLAAQMACMAKPGIHEAAFRASTPLMKDAALRSGLRFMVERPVMTFPAQQVAAGCIEGPLILDDAAYMHGSRPDYLT
jgi:hypothetical protein